MRSLVVMGVAGCGKSSLAGAIALATGWPMIEGDDFHPPANLGKMRAGIALSDSDRDGWLDALAAELQRHPHGVVMTCSALKRAYRDRLRAARPELRFAHAVIAPELALARVAQRAAAHVFPPTLVRSQFEALQSPAGEPGVMEVDATQALALSAAQIVHWMKGQP